MPLISLFLKYNVDGPASNAGLPWLPDKLERLCLNFL
jgi:hypothetical protein